MEITEVQLALIPGTSNKLKARATLIFDNQFAVENVRVIENSRGLHVAMPTWKVTTKCRECHSPSDYDCKYCRTCGATVKQFHAAKRHFDVAHPTNSGFRSQIERHVLSEYAARLEREKLAEDPHSDDKP